MKPLLNELSSKYTARRLRGRDLNIQSSKLIQIPMYLQIQLLHHSKYCVSSLQQQFNHVVPDTCDSRLRRSAMWSQISITLPGLTSLSTDSMFIVAVCCKDKYKYKYNVRSIYVKACGTHIPVGF
jgi:hypothetical protein